MDVNKCTDEELISAILKGDINLFGEVIRRYNQRMYRTAIAFGIQGDDCEDLIQTSYISAYEKLYQFEGRAKFSTWLLKILINECLMHKRRQKKNLDKFISTDNININNKTMGNVKSPQNILEEQEWLTKLEKEIEKMPEIYRTVFLMKEVEEMSIKEIAECLLISEINVKVRVYRAKSILKKYLKSGMKVKNILTFGNERCDRVVGNVLAFINKNK